MSSLPGIRKRAMRAGAILFAMLVSVVTVTVSQESQTQTQIKKAPAPVVSPASGEKMYVAYCAACHGKDGKGDGPAAPALKDPVPDLTTLAQRHNGKYPSAYVSTVLQFGVQGKAAHGSKEMPVWGPVFQAMVSPASSSTSSETMRIYNLNRYIETLQVK